jgi:ectoine hydroxylase-related dioxygenase (phytanoyl-CoA dioxygenase family)
MSHLFPIFDITQKSNIREYMHKNGYVVIKNILSKQDCKLTTFDINNQIQKLDPRFNIFKPETYG